MEYFLRSGRELELNKSWNNPSESRLRFQKLTCEGSEDMDNFLKVLNKQTRCNLYFRDIIFKKILMKLNTWLIFQRGIYLHT